MVAVSTVPSASFDVAFHVALFVVNPCGKAPICAPRLHWCAVGLVPVTRLVETCVIAVPIAHPSQRAPYRAHVCPLIRAAMATVPIIPQARADIALQVADHIAQS